MKKNFCQIWLDLWHEGQGEGAYRNEGAGSGFGMCIKRRRGLFGLLVSSALVLPALRFRVWTAILVCLVYLPGDVTYLQRMGSSSTWADFQNRGWEVTTQTRIAKARMRHNTSYTLHHKSMSTNTPLKRRCGWFLNHNAAQLSPETDFLACCDSAISATWATPGSKGWISLTLTNGGMTWDMFGYLNIRSDWLSYSRSPSAQRPWKMSPMDKRGSTFPVINRKLSWENIL
jgi:hypothetical protein